MTQADNATALRMSLDSGLIDQEQATPPVIRWAFCAVCGLSTKEPVMIGSTDCDSGPGRALYADPQCARAYAHTSDAPNWLREQYAGAV